MTFMSVPREPWDLIVGGSSIYYALDSDALGVLHRKQTVPRARPTDEYALWHWDQRRLPNDRLPRRLIVTYNQSSIVDRTEFDARTPCQSQILLERLDSQSYRELGCSTDGDASVVMAAADPWSARRGMVARAIGWHLRGFLGLDEPGPGPDLHRWKLEGVNQRHTRQRLEMWKRRGVLDRMPLPIHDQALGRIHDEARSRGVEVVALLMPEHALKRELYSPESVEAFDDLARRNSDRVIDLRDAVSDEGFFDDSHTNAEGRRVFTVRLRTELDAPASTGR